VLALLGLVVSIGLADSINPSTVLPALYFATAPRPRQLLASFALGVFATYLAGGVAVLLGGRELVQSLAPDLSPDLEHGLEIAAGAVLLGVAAGIWLLRDRVENRVAKPRGARAWSAFAVGAGIMAVELPTAFAYFAAIAAVGGSDDGTAVQLALLAVYNVCFVLPVLAILAARILAGPRGERMLLGMRDWTQRNAPAVLALTLVAIGLVLAGIGVAGLT
jgi:cytochrome c biogenesis protein CcdA